MIGRRMRRDRKEEGGEEAVEEAEEEMCRASAREMV